MVSGTGSKKQSSRDTEEDSVGAMLSEWTQLRQAEDESFDAYRARVEDELATLLEACQGEAVRTHVRDHALGTSAAALQAGSVSAKGRWPDERKPEKVCWDTVTAFIRLPRAK